MAGTKGLGRGPFTKAPIMFQRPSSGVGWLPPPSEVIPQQRGLSQLHLQVISLIELSQLEEDTKQIQWPFGSGCLSPVGQGKGRNLKLTLRHP